MTLKEYLEKQLKEFTILENPKKQLSEKFAIVLNWDKLLQCNYPIEMICHFVFSKLSKRAMIIMPEDIKFGIVKISLSNADVPPYYQKGYLVAQIAPFRLGGNVVLGWSPKNAPDVILSEAIYDFPIEFLAQLCDIVLNSKELLPSL
jgi:hypothetical protein